MLRITLNGQRINIPTHISVEEKAWDKDKQRIEGNDELTRQYNNTLRTLTSRAWEAYNNILKKEKMITAGTSNKPYLVRIVPSVPLWRPSIITSISYAFGWAGI